MRTACRQLAAISADYRDESTRAELPPSILAAISRTISAISERLADLGADAKAAQARPLRASLP